MKKMILRLLILIVFVFSFNNSNAQTVRYSYSRPAWTIGFGPSWDLATNDAYGRANYASEDQILRDNFGMRWGFGGYLFGKYSPGKMRNDRIFLGFDYKDMSNKDMDSEGNKTQYNLVTIDAGYEYLFYGTYGFRSYYGAGLTGNFISGTYTPNHATQTNDTKTFESAFRLGMELKAGLEFVFNSSRKNIGLNVGATYNLVNLFNDENQSPELGQTQNLNLNDGSGTGGPGFKRYIGVVSINVGLNIYPDVKKIKR